MQKDNKIGLAAKKARKGFRGVLDRLFAKKEKGPAPRLFVVGKWKDRLLKMGETLSVLILAPPGTGKSVGFVVPSIVTMDKTCLLVHDQKPELHLMTSNYRAKIGPVYQLAWAATDAPEGKYISSEEEKYISPDVLERNASGEIVRHPGTGEAKTVPLFYPSWNPLSPKSMPTFGPRRDMYIDRLVNVLAPDPKGGDVFWTRKARAALIGFIHYICAKVELANDPELDIDWDPIPENWHHMEASFPMLVDWLGYSQSDLGDGDSDDPQRDMFMKIVQDAKAIDQYLDQTRGIRPMNRAILEITSLAQSPDKTRGSIITTLDEALNPFRNEAVRQRTMSSDLPFSELRGRPIPDAEAREQKKVEDACARGDEYKPRYAPEEFEPVSIYICVNLEDAKALSVITGIFVDAANSYLVANGPSTIDDQGNQLGPYDFCFMLDECPQLPKLENTVMNGPAVGRSKKISYILIGQDYGQFMQKYSKEEVETLKSTTAIKIILSQNNESTAEAISKAAGKMTFMKQGFNDGGKKKPFDMKGILGEMFETKKTTSSESFESTEFLKSADLMSLPPNKHVVLVQNFMNRPIMADTPKFFLDKDLASRVFNLMNFTGPAPCPPMPRRDSDAALKRHNEIRQRKAGGATGGTAGATMQQAYDPRHVIIATPRDIQALSRDPFGNKGDLGDLFAAAAVEIEERARYTHLPSDPGEILVTNDPAEIAQLVGSSKIILFNQTNLEEELNAPLSARGAQPIDPAQLVSISEFAADLGESAGEDIFRLGFDGGASLDPPDAPEKVTPEFTLSWVSEIVTFLLGCREHKRMFAEAD
nr:type IV secretory system conjugative DNA transfer family protein [Rhodovibrio sodomensis]